MPRPARGANDPERELEILLVTHHPLVAVETLEDAALEDLLRRVCTRLTLPLFTWKAHRGLSATLPAEGPSIPGTEQPGRALAFAEESPRELVLHLRDASHILAEPAVTARLKDVARKLARHRGAVVASDAQIDLPAGLASQFAVLELAPPDDQAYRGLVEAIVRDVGARRPVAVRLSGAEVDELVVALRGLPLSEARRWLSRAVFEDGVLDRTDLSLVAAAKRRALERTGVLEYFPPEHSLADVAGLGRLKAWLAKRSNAFSDPGRARAFGLTPPRGLLLLGVQGCGKSLTAKAIAAEWRLPLVRLDPAHLFQKYIGETEKSLRRATSAAERMAPLVLWVDELEKAFATGGDSDAGTGRRLLGSFLSWLQEKPDGVFVVATANDVSRLPPELLRKGRFDEIFFVDLPSQEVREEILRVHLRRRGRDPARFDVPLLAAQTEGFSGAEIEQVVVSALYTAFHEGTDVDTHLLTHEILTTVPLSVTLAEAVTALRAWAAERAVPAD